ncbi:SPOSA6832_02313, partial [Sporobolomyces salmonicolor]
MWAAVDSALTPHGKGRETAFTPAAYVFYTWTIIDILLAGFVIWQFFDASHDAIHGVGYRFALVGVLNSIFVSPHALCLLSGVSDRNGSFPQASSIRRSSLILYRDPQIHVFVTRHFIVAFIFALLVASSVSTVYYSLAAHYPPKGLADYAFVHLPFSLWHAWSIVTVLISAFALFTHGGHHTHPSVLTRILVSVALAFLAVTSVGYAFRSRKGDVAGALVLAWTEYGIYAYQTDHVIRYFALGSFIVSLAAIVKVSRSSPLLSIERKLTVSGGECQSLYFSFVANDGAISLGDDSERQPLVA